MKYTDHCLLSVEKFGGESSDYIELHKFMDSSKLFYYHAKHRLLLHNLYGVELSIELFGDFMQLSNGNIVLTRDIAVEHCKEDLSGKIPTLNNWLDKYECDVVRLDEVIQRLKLIDNLRLKEFILRPYFRSGIVSSLAITNSNFGRYLVNKFFSVNDVLLLDKVGVFNLSIDNWLGKYNYTSNWQFTPNQKDLKTLKNII